MNKKNLKKGIKKEKSTWSKICRSSYKRQKPI